MMVMDMASLWMRHSLQKCSVWLENVISAKVWGKEISLAISHTHTLIVKGNVRSGVLISCIFHADYLLVKHLQCVKSSTVNWQFAGFTDRNAETTERMPLKFPNSPHQVTTPFTLRSQCRRCRCHCCVRREKTYSASDDLKSTTLTLQFI